MDEGHFRRKLTPRRIIIILAVLALVGGLGYRLYPYAGVLIFGAEKFFGYNNYDLHVKASKPKQETLTVTVSAIGTLRADQSVTIAPEIDGRIVFITDKEGRRVEKGEVLLKLDDAIDRADLAQARAELTLAQTTYERAQGLVEKKVGTERARDEALSGLRVAEAHVALAQARVAKATIEAPFGGILGLRQKSIGGYVQAGDVVLTLTSIDPLLVDFRIPETDFAAIKVGQQLEFSTDALPDLFHAVVVAIDPQIDIDGRSLAVRARVENPDHVLRPGLFARVQLVVSRRENALIVPESAIVMQADSAAVYKMVDDKTMLTKVKMGLRRYGDVEIIEGISADDLIVTDGQIKLQDGTKVVVEIADPASSEPAASTQESSETPAPEASEPAESMPEEDQAPAEESAPEPTTDESGTP